ncbi:hypothetical protein AAC387_Pa03g2201 [Persea americana]
MGLRPIQVSSYPFIFEASGDSEDDHSLSGSTGCECDMSYAEVADDDDDAESCSCDSWGINAANGCVDDDDDEQGGSHGGNEDYGNDDEDRWDFGNTGVPNLFKGCVPCDQEDEEIVEATMVLREAMDAMEDKEFWEACLATGYP